ncbi:MAG: DNA translocase FtsK 4TM domain-containing protein [Candidatus Puniceispirillales bacterium]
MVQQGDKAPIISPAISAWFARVLYKLAASVLFVVGICLMLMVLSHNPSDPSINSTANDIAQTNNIFGIYGANISSWLIQAFGFIVAMALAVIPLIWSYRMWQNRWQGGVIRRLILMPFVLILMATVIRAIPLFFDMFVYGNGTGQAMYHLIFEYPVLNQPIIESPVLINGQYLIALCLMIIAVIGYIYIASIGTNELRILGKGYQLTRAAVINLFRGIAKAKTLAAEKRPSKPRTKRKSPAPRREPIIVAGKDEAEADISSGKTSKRRKKTATGKQASLDLASPSGYHLPSPALLAEPNETLIAPDAEALDNTSRMLEGVLSEFGIGGNIEKARFGPVVTRYELNPAPGTKTQRVISLSDDIARSMSALSVRVAVVPGQNTIGIELPNTNRQTVLIRDILDHDDWDNSKASLPMALGMDIAGNPVVADLTRMPHLLVAGTTGSGKSVGINGMILSLLYTHTPETCRLIMIDPKMLELSVYDGIPHLLTPVVTDPNKAVVALKWAVREMENRYRNMAKVGVRNIDGFNKYILDAKRKGESLSRRVQTGFDEESGQPVYEEEQLDLNLLPYIVVVIDEVADLMLVAGKDIEAMVQRLAQMARAAGIHVIMATQRPSVDVITGTIKANFPTRISFQVTSRIDSRTILGEQGAEHLLGRGDMLYMEGGGRIVRVHGPFVSDDEVEKVASFLRQQGEPEYDDSVTVEADPQSNGDQGTSDLDGDASLYDQAVELVRREGKASTSFIQRHLRIGYNRAATIIEDMERNGLVSPANHAGKREILMDTDNG